MKKFKHKFYPKLSPKNNYSSSSQNKRFAVLRKESLRVDKEPIENQKTKFGILARAQKKPLGSYKPIRDSNLTNSSRLSPSSKASKSPTVREVYDHSKYEIVKQQKKKRLKRRSKNNKTGKRNKAEYLIFGGLTERLSPVVNTQRIKIESKPTTLDKDYKLSGLKKYEIRARKRSAREIVVSVKNRLRKSQPEYYLKPNPRFGHRSHPYSESRNNLKKDLIYRVSKIEYFRDTASKQAHSISRAKAVDIEYGLQTVEAPRTIVYDPSPLPRRQRYSPNTAPKNSGTSISKYEKSDFKEKSVDKYTTLKTNNSQKIKPIELSQDEETLDIESSGLKKVIEQNPNTFDSPDKKSKKLY